VTNPDGPRPAGAPGPRWLGDGAMARPSSATPVTDPDAREAPFVVGGNEPMPRTVGAHGLEHQTAKVRGRRIPPPAGYEAYAPFWRRCLAFAVDEIIKTSIYLIIFALTGSVPAADAANLSFADIAPRLLLSMGYDWMFWSQGWTPGTALMGIRIVRADGSAPGPLFAAVRVAGSLVSAMALFVGFAWMLWSPRRQTWHDILARTMVVMVPPKEGERR